MNYHGSKQQAGFTLKEVIIIILLMIILMANVAPRAFEVKTQSKLVTLETMGSAIQAAGKMVYSKAAMQNIHKYPKTTIDLDKDGIDDVEIAYGYPSASRGNGISKIMGSDFEGQWTWSTTYGDTRFWLTTAALGGRSGQYVNQTAVRDSGCYILYDPATEIGGKPQISYVTDKC